MVDQIGPRQFERPASASNSLAADQTAANAALAARSGAVARLSAARSSGDPLAINAAEQELSQATGALTRAVAWVRLGRRLSVLA